jgi:hypothetical protein
MPGPAFSDAEFIELWRTHKSPSKIAEITGIGIRALKGRRRRVEQRLNITLDVDHPKGQHYKHLHPVEHKARRHVEIEAGTVIVFSDAHFWPGVRTTAFRALVKFIQDMKPKAVCCNGDAFDGASISRYPRIGWDSTPTVIDELKACQEALGEISEAAKDAIKQWELGNHDSRYESRLAMNAPQFEGVKGFTLKDHFPDWTPCWSTWINNEVVIKHRFKGGVHATHNNAVNAGKTTVTGHLHSLKVTPFDDYNGTRWGVDTGTLAEPNGPQFIDYSEDNPKNHRSGFAVLTFHNRRLLWPEVVHAREANQVEFRGQVISV